jgi:Tol biopolymer transport system component
MEYVGGTPLEGPLPVARAVELACQILDAIGAAHRRGFMHRDLKPANVLVTAQGIKLLDFGLAKPVSPLLSGDHVETLKPMTAVGQIVGTPQYMAPEQLQGKEADARSDLFAFGCVFYELLTGKRAFEGGDPASVIAAVLTREAPSVSAVAPGLERVVQRALAKDPEQRFQTAGDLKAALLWAVEHTAPATPVATPSRRLWPLVAAGVAVAALCAGAGWWIARGAAVPAADRVVKFEIAAPNGGQFVFGVNGGGMALSPDGMTIGFVASGDGRNNVWTRRIDETQAKLVPGTTAASYAFWSPDGRSIGFTVGNSMRRVDLATGSTLVICRVNALRGALWLPSGEIIFGTNASGLQTVAATGGTPRRLTEPDVALKEGFHGFPQLIADDRILYFARSELPERTGIYSAPLSNPSQRTFLLETEANAVYGGAADGSRYLLWTRGGTLLAQAFDAPGLKLAGEARGLGGSIGSAGITGSINATASLTGTLAFSSSSVTSQFTWFDRSGQRSGTVGEPGDYNTFDLSHDGKRIVASLDRPGGSDLWLIDTTRGGLVTRLTTRPATSVYPVWAPDGSAVVFGSEALNNVFWKSLNGGEERRLNTSLRTELPLDWSADGGSVLIYQFGSSETGRDLAVVPMTGGGGAPVQYLKTPFNEWWARFVPVTPGKWVAYQSDESGQWEIYVDSYPKPANRRRISSGGGQFPNWGPGGRELFFLAPDYTLMSVEITFRSDGVDSSTPKPLFRLPAVDTGRNPYEVGPDGQRFLVRATPPGASSPLTAIVNWPQLLKQ